MSDRLLRIVRVRDLDHRRKTIRVGLARCVLSGMRGTQARLDALRPANDRTGPLLSRKADAIFAARIDDARSAIAADIGRGEAQAARLEAERAAAEVVAAIAGKFAAKAGVVKARESALRADANRIAPRAARRGL